MLRSVDVRSIKGRNRRRVRMFWAKSDGLGIGGFLGHSPMHGKSFRVA